MAVIGIDLGTTNSLVSVWKDEKVVLIPNGFGEVLTPSVVSLDHDNTVLVGKIAKERLVSHPDRTASSFKQFMGSSKVFALGKSSFYAEDLSAMVLRQLKEDAERFLGEDVTEAVVSVPAYFNNKQRTTTKNAGKLAGLYVERIINEPSAAAIAYEHSLGKDGTFLVFDLGGGTLDISVVDIFENVVDILAVSGDNHLGGDNFNNVILDAFLARHPKLVDLLTPEEMASLRKLAEQCKIALSSTEQSYMLYQYKGETFEMALTHEELLKLSAPLLQRIRGVLGAALRGGELSIGQIDEVVLVGGSTKMPLIQEYIRHMTQMNPSRSLDPDRVVGIGAGLVSGIKQRKDGLKDTVLVDICPFTLGTAIRKKGSMSSTLSPIIERNTSLPVSNQHLYVTTSDNQTLVRIEIYQGEELEAEKNLLLGELTIDVPPLPAGKALINVRFSYDINGILDVDVTCLNNGLKKNKLIVQDENMEQTDLARRIEELQKLKISPPDKQENKMLIAQAERLYAESYGEVRGFIEQALQEFLETISKNQSITEEKKARKQLRSFLKTLDVFDDGLSEDDFSI